MRLQQLIDLILSTIWMQLKFPLWQASYVISVVYDKFKATEIILWQLLWLRDIAFCVTKPLTICLLKSALQILLRVITSPWSLAVYVCVFVCMCVCMRNWVIVCMYVYPFALMYVPSQLKFFKSSIWNWTLSVELHKSRFSPP